MGTVGTREVWTEQLLDKHFLKPPSPPWSQGRGASDLFSLSLNCHMGRVIPTPQGTA